MASKPLQRLQKKEARLLPGENPKPRSAVGALLRQRRMERGLGLRDVADHIRIRSNHLEAIESGRFEDLPGRTYAIGFVRSYAEWLDLDGEEIIRRFRDEAAGLGDATALVFPSPAPEGKVPGGLVLMIGLVLVAAIYGGWFTLSTRNMAVADLVPEVPERLSQWLAERRTASVVAIPGAGALPLDVQRQAAPVPRVERASEELPAPPAIPPRSTAKSTPAPAPPAVQTTLITPPVPQVQPVAPAPIGLAAPTQEVAVAPARVVPERPNPTPSRPVEIASAPATPTPPAEAAVPVAAEPASQAEDDDSEETSTPPPETTNGTALADSAQNAPTGRFPGMADLADSNAEPQGRLIAVRPPTVAALPPTAIQIPALPGTAMAPDASGARIVIRATDECWVQVRDADRNPIMTRVLVRGDVYRVPNRPGLTLQAGNAGALEILVDGLPVPAIGPIGSVRRDVLLEPDRLRVGGILTLDR
ncbi:MAG: DUF4115 domain-containing protein [Alphaproteobacteria bacterium]|nr:DUF4115 domain-containing protein [Alphaproteobacteria bacterium]